MSRRDDYDDDYEDRGPRRPRRDDYDDDYDAPARRRGGPKSGLVTTMGIIHIVLGSIALLFGLCTMIGGLFLTGAAADLERMAGPGAPRAGTTGGILIIILSIVMMAAAGGGIAGGVGTLQRRFWGWVLGLVAAGLSGIIAILSLIGMIQAFGLPFNRTGPILFNLLGLLLAAGYSAFVFIVSFQPHVRSEFR